MKGVIDIANKDPTVLHKDLLQAMGLRIKDRKVRVRVRFSSRAVFCFIFFFSINVCKCCVAVYLRPVCE